MKIAKELAVLQRLSPSDLRNRYADIFGEESRTKNKVWLIKRIAWRLQSQAEGDLSERARQRAAELANDADLRLSPPNDDDSLKPAPARTVTTSLAATPDRRLPPPSSVLTRTYKGQTFRVTVRADGFEWEGEAYKTLSAVAKAITGQHLNGYAFFGLKKEKAR